MSPLLLRLISKFMLQLRDKFCLHVQVFPCRSLFVASQDVATSQPGHGVFESITRGMKPGGNEGPGWQDSTMKISVHFIHFYPSKVPNFNPDWHAPPLSRRLPFEHSSPKMGSLDFEAVHSTLCPSIISTHSISKLHLLMFQCSVVGAVMLNAITDGQGCTLCA